MNNIEIVFQCEDFMEKLFSLFYSVHRACCRAAYGDPSMFDKRLEIHVVDACAPSSTLPIVDQDMIVNIVRHIADETEDVLPLPYTQQEAEKYPSQFELPSLPVYSHCESTLAAYITTLKFHPTMAMICLATSRPLGICLPCRWYMSGVCDYLLDNNDTEEPVIICRRSSVTPPWWTVPGIVSGDQKERLEECVKDSVELRLENVIRRIEKRRTPSGLSWLFDNAPT